MAKLISIIQMFDYTSDKSKLQALVELAEGLDTSSLPSDLKEALESALDEAKSVLEDQTALDAQIQEALTKLQEAVDNATYALLNAAMELRLILDKTELQALVAQAQTLTLSAYTDESAEALTAALNAAVFVLKNDEAEQEDVQSSIIEVTTAMKNLVSATTDETTTGTATAADGTSTDGTSTSDDTSSTDGTSSSSGKAITGSPIYRFNWEDILYELTSNFSYGVNRVIFYGSAYSKSLDGYNSDWPGWDPFGNGSSFGELYTYRQTYWEDMSTVTEYVARNQALLQKPQATTMQRLQNYINSL